MVRATLPVKPFLGVTVMVLLPLAPSTTFRAGVEFESEKDDGEAMLSAMATVAAKLPDVPLTITVAVPAVAAALAVKVRVLDVVVLTGLNKAVTPAGKPEMVMATAPLNPFAGTTVMEAEPVAL